MKKQRSDIEIIDEIVANLDFINRFGYKGELKNTLNDLETDALLEINWSLSAIILAIGTKRSTTQSDDNVLFIDKLYLKT